MDQTFNKCKHIGHCGSCNFYKLSLEEQIQSKKKEFIEKFAAVLPESLKTDFLNNVENRIFATKLANENFRTKIDLSFHNSNWGMWGLDQKFEALNECILICPELKQLMQEFIQIKWPFEKASCRLRVGENSERGIWLDLSNLDVKNLFENPEPLEKCLKIANVEIGQRRKRLKQIDGKMKLLDPEFGAWTSSFLKNEKIDLNAYIGSFTQTGPIAIKKIHEILSKYLKSNLDKNKDVVLEFGPGCGTLSFMLSDYAQELYALEVDNTAIESLTKSMQKYSVQNIQILKGDFQKKSPPTEILEKVSVYCVNPPKSGVQNLFLNIPKQVQHVIYMSCFLDSFIKDSQQLLDQNFSLDQAHLIDQFAHSQHSEWLTFWKRK